MGMKSSRLAVATACLAVTWGLLAAPAHAGGEVRATGAAVVTAGSLRGSATVAGEFHLMAVGDIAREGGAQASTAALVAARDPQALVLLGDLAYPDGSATDYATWFAPAYGRFDAITWAVPGNHEYHTPGAAGYRSYFGVTGPTWWARRAGSWLVIGLDTEKLRSTRQRAFVTSTLRSNNGRPTLVVWHRPRYTSGKHRDQRDVGVLWKLVKRDKDVQLALWGHDHDYERMTVPVTGRRAKAAFVVGTGGDELRAVKRYPGRWWSRRIITGTYGVLDVVLRPSTFSWSFIGADGTSLDAGTRAVVRR